MEFPSTDASPVREPSGRSSPGVCNVFKCPNCSAYFKAQFMYHQHVRYCSRFNCNICHKRLNEYGELKLHVWRQHQVRVHCCRACRYISYNSSHQEVHKQQNCTLNGLYECETCAQVFLTFTALQRHREIHFSLGLFKCRYCSYASTSKFYVKAHMRDHTTLKVKMRCPYCAWTSDTVGRMKTHVKKAPTSKCDLQPCLFQTL